MNQTHNRLLTLAKEAIRNLFSDRSVSAQVSRESLQELVAVIEMMIDSLGVKGDSA